MQSKQTFQAAVRVFHEDKTRRIRLAEVTLTCLAKSVSERFETSSALTFGYLDAEGDFVPISSDQQLLFALNQRKLRLIAKPAQPAPAVAPPVVQPVRVYQPEPVVTLPQAVAPVTNESKEHVEEKKSGRRKSSAQTKPSIDQTSLKTKSVRIVSQFFLLKGSNEPNEKKRLVVAPGTKFTKVWKVKNDSKEAWPDSRLSLVQGDQEALRVPAAVRMARLNPSEETEIRVSGTAPKQAGKFTCVFRFSSNEKFVGKSLKIIVVVKDPEEKAIPQKEEPVAKNNRRQEVKEPERDLGKERAPRVKRERRPKKDSNAN